MPAHIESSLTGVLPHGWGEVTNYAQRGMGAAKNITAKERQSGVIFENLRVDKRICRISTKRKGRATIGALAKIKPIATIPHSDARNFGSAARRPA
jgi:hypothetical protein